MSKSSDDLGLVNDGRSWWALGSHLDQCLRPAHLRRTAAIALVVGSWLTAFNQSDQLLAEALSPFLALKVALNYLTPFVVANLGILSRRPVPRHAEPEPAAAPSDGGQGKTGGQAGDQGSRDGRREADNGHSTQP